MTTPTYISFLLLAAVPASGQTTEFDVKGWKSTAPVQVFAGDRYGSLLLDAGAWKSTESSLRDLRLRDSSDKEVPYVLQDLSVAQDAIEDIRPMLYDRVVTPRGTLQFMLDFGESTPVHNLMRMRWSDRNFRRRMQIESSENGRIWDFVKSTTLLDFDVDGQVFRTEDIEYPATSRRYLRVVIDDWKDSGALVSVRSRHVKQTEAEWIDLGNVPFILSNESAGAGTQVIQMTLPFNAPERLRLRFEAVESDFVRSAEIASELPGQRWITACNGTLVRAGDTDHPMVDCSTVLARKLRVTIRNGNDSPLTIRAVKAMAPAQRMIFPLRPERPYRLYAGNAQARAPIYDLAAVLRTAPAIDPKPAQLGAWAANPAYVPPDRPASERARGWLTALLVVILIGIFLTARFLIRMATRGRRRYV